MKEKRDEKKGALAGGEPPREFEDIIDHLGAFGHWQRVIFTLICVGDLFGCFSIMVPVFSGATPDWSCSQFSGDVNITGLRLAGKINDTEGTCAYENHTCVKYDFADDFTSVVSKWSLVCDKKYVSDLITSIQMVGLLIGAAAFGQLSDLIGRKISYFGAHTLLTVFGLISAFVPLWEVYIFSRFLVGIGFGGTMVVNCVYPLEFVGHKWRTLTGTIGFWAIGEMILALVAFFLTEWNYLVIATASSGFLYILLWPIIPESPRWLCQKGRFDEASVILDKIARKNNKPPVDISVLKAYAKEEALQNQIEKKYTYIDLFRRRKYAKYTLITVATWFTTFLTYYTLSYNLRNFSGNRSLNMFYGGIVDLAAMMLVILIGNCIGRRLGLILFLSVSLVSLIALVIIVATGILAVPGWVVMMFALVGKGSALGGTYMCQIYSAELFPTVIRNVGVGAGSIAARIGGILAPQILFLKYYFDLAPYLLPMILFVLVTPLLFFLPETKGRPLSDVYKSQILHLEPEVEPELEPEDKESTKL